MTVPEPTQRATRYEVSCLPEDHIDAYAFTLRAEYRGAGRWAVTDGHRYFSADGGVSYGFGWDHEPVGDEEMDAFEREREEWLTEYRSDEETALRIAKERAPLMTVSGWTVQDALDKAAESAKEDTDGS